jgi:hypothetical protein
MTRVAEPWETQYCRRTWDLELFEVFTENCICFMAF